MLTALENWVEKGIAPDKVIATHSTAGKVDRTRPLCAYPAVARYTGKGSIDEAASFACVTPAEPSRTRTSQQ
jgi:feruloyl esterase